MNINCILKNENRTYKLQQNEEKEVSEGRYSLLIEGLKPHQKKNFSLEINGDFYDVINKKSYTTIIDLINNIGFNNISIYYNKNKIYKTSFYTRTYKLKKQDFLKLLEFISNSNNVFWYKNQFAYYDKKNLKHKIIDPLFIFNWIKSYFQKIEELIFKINRDPNKKIHVNYKKSYINTNKYCKQKTISYLKNNYDQFYEQSGGIISINDTNYNPQSIIVKEKRSNLRFNEHLQMLELIQSIYKFLKDLDKELAYYKSKAIRESCQKEIRKRNWLKRLIYLKQNTFLREITLLKSSDVKRFPISKLQLTNFEYGRLYNIYADFLNNYYSFINELKENHNQHIRNIDKLYEAFCCYMIADILDLKMHNNDFLSSGKVFSNDDFEIYYQSKPKKLKGWALSDQPDIILKSSRTNKLLILDCKFKIKNRNDVKGEDIQKIQAYMNNYFESFGGIIFPNAKADANNVSFLAAEDKISNQYKIYKIPIYPWRLDKYKKLRPVIESKLKHILN